MIRQTVYSTKHRFVEWNYLSRRKQVIGVLWYGSSCINVKEYSPEERLNNSPQIFIRRKYFFYSDLETIAPIYPNQPGKPRSSSLKTEHSHIELNWWAGSSTKTTKSSGHTLMLLILLPAWDRRYTALSVHLQALFHCGKGRHTHTHILPASASQSHSRIVQSSTYWSQGPWYLVDVLYSRPPSPIHLSRRSKLQKTNCLKLSVERSSGQFGRRTAKRMWRGGTLTFVCKREKMLGKKRQSSKQSVFLYVVVHPFHSSSPSHSLPPASSPLSNWCPQSCVSPHLPALKLHQPYLLLSLSMIIIIIIVIIVVIMVRDAVIACYF